MQSLNIYRFFTSCLSQVPNKSLLFTTLFGDLFVMHSSCSASTVMRSFCIPPQKKSSFLLMSLTLAPLIRILSLYAPLASFTYLHWFIILSLPLFTATVIIIVFQQLNARDVGLVLKSRQIPVQFAICFTGTSLLAISSISS